MTYACLIMRTRTWSVGRLRFKCVPSKAWSLVRIAKKLAELLILDGQQRLTSLTQVLSLNSAVSTRDSKRKEIRLHYYIDIRKALEGPEALSDAIIGVDESLTLKSDFGRRIDLDLSSPEREIAAFHFPCSNLNSNDWEVMLEVEWSRKEPRAKPKDTSIT